MKCDDYIKFQYLTIKILSLVVLFIDFEIF